MLFNDRYGMHRLNYHEGKDAFYFAVEAKAILAVLPELRRIDERSLGEFVSCGCVLENRTLFTGICRAAAGIALDISARRARGQAAVFFPEGMGEPGGACGRALPRGAPRVVRVGPPVVFPGDRARGMSLTGGLDTRLVLAWRGADAGPLPCYTYGDSYRECRDVTVARRVAATCGLPHRVIAVDGEFLSRFAHYAERSMFLTDACVDVTRAADLYLSEKARDIAPVRMTGFVRGRDSASTHAGVQAAGHRAGSVRPRLPCACDVARQTYVAATECHPLSFAAFRQAPWHHYGALALEQTQLTVRTPFLDNAFVRTAFRAPASAMRNNDLRSRLIREGSPALGRIRTESGFAGNGSGVSSWVAQNFLEFTFKAEYTFDYGMPQWLARVDHCCRRCISSEIFLGRHKLYHYRVWYRDTLSAYVKEMLLDPRTLARPYLSRNGVELVVRRHVRPTELHDKKSIACCR